MTKRSTIPTICLRTGSDHAKMVSAIRSACLQTGFFYVTEHGIDTQKVLDQSKLLFDLPLQEKQRVADSRMSRGYTAMREETLDPSTQKVGDTKEGFYISMNDIPAWDSRYNPAKLSGPNQWPTKTTCPSLHDPVSFKKVMNEYLNEVDKLSRTVVGLIAESLGLPSSFFDFAFEAEPLAVLRLLHYEATTSNIDDGILACGAHSDYGMITLLLADQESGLEIFDKRGSQQWLQVPPVAGSFVVNLGDMLERWSNDVYCSTLHRVINRSGRERYSIPFFFEPSFDTVVKCLDVCCSGEQPPKYPPVTSGEHLLAKYNETHAEFSSTDSPK